MIFFTKRKVFSKDNGDTTQMLEFRGIDPLKGLIIGVM